MKLEGFPGAFPANLQIRRGGMKPKEDNGKFFELSINAKGFNGNPWKFSGDPLRPFALEEILDTKTCFLKAMGIL